MDELYSLDKKRVMGDGDDVAFLLIDVTAATAARINDQEYCVSTTSLRW